MRETAGIPHELDDLLSTQAPGAALTHQAQSPRDRLRAASRTRPEPVGVTIRAREAELLQLFGARRVADYLKTGATRNLPARELADKPPVAPTKTF